MADTPNLQLTFLEANQAQKHITVNEAFRALDALVQPAVESTGLNTPPGSPVDGARYVVGAAPTGAWAGQAFAIAAWQDGAWAFYPPAEGWSIWDRATDAALAFLGGVWVRQTALPFPDNLFRLSDDADPTRLAAFDLSGRSAGTTRTFTLPNLSATLAHLGNAAQTFVGATTFSNATITIGTATTTAAYGIGTGGTTTGVTKTVNLGTGGAAGSTTVIHAPLADATRLPSWLRAKLRGMLAEAQADATTLLRVHRAVLDQVAQSLLAERDLDAGAIAALLPPLPRPEPVAANDNVILFPRHRAAAPCPTPGASA